MTKPDLRKVVASQLGDMDNLPPDKLCDAITDAVWGFAQGAEQQGFEKAVRFLLHEIMQCLYYSGYEAGR